MRTSCPGAEHLTYLPGTGPVLTAKDVGPQQAGHQLGNWDDKGPGKWFERRYLKSEGFEGPQTSTETVQLLK